MLYKGFYYDGKSSYQNNCFAEIIDTQLIIRLENDISITWHIERIHNNQFLSGDKITLQYGNFPVETLEIFDADFLAELKRNSKIKKSTKSIYYGIYDNSRNIVILSILSLSILIGLYFFVIPFLAEGIATQIPHSTEKVIGNSIAKALLSNLKIDTERTLVMNEFIKKINLPNDDKNRRIELDIKVVDDDLVNAFAIMGGTIIVHRGILEKIQTPEELAALLSHEYIHIYEKHSSKMIFRSLSSYFLLSFLLNDYSGVSAIIIQNADSFNNLQYSRESEKQADIQSAKILIENGINLTGLKDLLLLLLNEESISVPSLLMTHPKTEERIKYVQELIKDNSTMIWNKNIALDELWVKLKY